jgi:hypothetical protein
MTEVIQRFSDFTKKILYNQKSKCIECQKFYGTNYNLFMCSRCFYKFKNISPPKEYELDMKKFWKENNYKIFPSDIFDNICKSLSFNLMGTHLMTGTQISYKIHNLLRITNKLPMLPSNISTIKCDDDENNENICNICYENKRNIRFIPCGHTIMCSDCFTKDDTYECPFCRTELTEIVNYDSQFDDFDIEKHIPQKCMFSDEQAIKFVKILNWQSKIDGFRISHAITRWRLTPWSKYKFEEFHPSSFCYYGNFREEPISQEFLISIYENNLTNFADV